MWCWQPHPVCGLFWGLCVGFVFWGSKVLNLGVVRLMHLLLCSYGSVSWLRNSTLFRCYKDLLYFLRLTFKNCLIFKYLILLKKKKKGETLSLPLSLSSLSLSPSLSLIPWVYNLLCWHGLLRSSLFLTDTQLLFYCSSHIYEIWDIYISCIYMYRYMYRYLHISHIYVSISYLFLQTLFSHFFLLIHCSVHLCIIPTLS